MKEVLYKFFDVGLITALGVFLFRKKYVTPAFLKEASWLVIHILTPAFIIYSFISNFSFSDFVVYLALPTVSILTLGSAYIIARAAAAVCNFDEDTKKTFVFMNIVTNYSFLPITIVYFLFGSQGLMLLFLHNIGCTFMHWTVGVRTLSGKTEDGQNILKRLVTPGICAVGLGIALSFVEKWIPDFFLSSLEIVGRATIPMALLVVGGVIGQVPINLKEKAGPVLALALTRSIIIPLVGIGIIHLFSLPETARKVAMIVAIMPSASTSAVFVKQYGGNLSLAAKGFVLTTLCCLILLPAFYCLF